MSISYPSDAKDKEIEKLTTRVKQLESQQRDQEDNLVRYERMLEQIRSILENGPYNNV